MFVDPKFFPLDPFIHAILSIVGQDTETRRIGLGLYITGDWNFSKRIGGEEQGWTEFSHHDRSYDLWNHHQLHEYGVCDSPAQFMEVHGEKLANDARREFVVSFVSIRKREQHPTGGWRWHKWGEYIGTQDPQCEYLYDEPVIDEVYTFHAYHRAVRGTSEAALP
jgi:hypothetical protein